MSAPLVALWCLHLHAVACLQVRDDIVQDQMTEMGYEFEPNPVASRGRGFAPRGRAGGRAAAAPTPPRSVNSGFQPTRDVHFTTSNNILFHCSTGTLDSTTLLHPILGSAYRICSNCLFANSLFAPILCLRHVSSSFCAAMDF